MIKNYFKIAWRNLMKNKVYFLINTLGLSIALTASFIILLWVYDEYSMDKFHALDEQIYRVKRTIPLEEGVLDVYEGISYPLLKTAVEELPEVQQYITLGAVFEDNLKVENTNLRARGAFTNAAFFSGFSYPVLAGDISQLDRKPEAIAISRDLASRFWGGDWETRAIGSNIHIFDNGDFIVEAVYEDFPKNSSIQSDFYYSFDKHLKDNDWMLEWGNNGMQGALVLRKDADLKLVSAKLNDLFQSHIKGEQKEGCFLQKYSDDYLYNQFNERAEVSGGRIEYVRIFSVAAIFLLIISCINFINLSTAYATKRAAEVGVRKVIGASKRTLIRQFLMETAIITGISFYLAYLFTILLLPGVNSFADENLSVHESLPGLWAGILGVYVLTTLLAGAYPAFVLSSFKPVDALKGKGQEKGNTIALRKSLVVLQFGLTILLIVAALVVRLQIDYINHLDLGIARDHLVSVHQDKVITEKYPVLRKELLDSGGISDVTLVGPSPLDMVASSSGMAWPGKTDQQENIEFYLLWTAYNFPEVFDVPISAGSYYREGNTDSLNIVLNQKAVEVMGLRDPVGKTIQVWGKPRQVIGVLADFHNKSLYEPIAPSVFFLDPGNAGTLFVKIKPGRTTEALHDLQATFAGILPGIPLHYDFVDQEYAAKYKGELLTGSLAFYFALISILISCLGLFGLATFMARQRVREMGIRKVLGASSAGITALMSGDFLKLVLFSFIIAAPAAYFFMDNWLQDFEFKIRIPWGVFALTGLVAVGITLLTVGYHSLKTANTNPVNSLRTE